MIKAKDLIDKAFILREPNENTAVIVRCSLKCQSCKSREEMGESCCEECKIRGCGLDDTED